VSLETSSTNGFTIVRLPTRLDAAVADAVRTELVSMLGAAGTKLLLDLSMVQFIDSTGLGVLVTAHKTAVAKDLKFALFALPDPVRAIVEVTRLHSVFDIYPDRDSALAALCHGN
jgi:anti-sigma B factor antagonist